mgnify:CR=1 FL=1
MDDPVAVWREALGDETHPRHRLAWTLFPESMVADAAARRLEAHKDEVIPLLLEILDTPDLYDEESLGGGFAPIHAVELLGHWGVVAAAPRLLKIIEEKDEDATVYDRATVALTRMGPAILEDVLALAGRAAPAKRPAIAEVLAAAGQGDSRAYGWIEARFDEARDEWGRVYMAEMLLQADPARAIPYLEARIKAFRGPYRARAENLIRRARERIAPPPADK